MISFYFSLFFFFIFRLLYTAKEKIALEPEQSIFFDLSTYWWGDRPIKGFDFEGNWSNKWELELDIYGFERLMDQDRPKWIYLWFFEPKYRERFYLSSSLLTWVTSGYKLIQTFMQLFLFASIASLIKMFLAGYLYLWNEWLITATLIHLFTFSIFYKLFERK